MIGLAIQKLKIILPDGQEDDRSFDNHHDAIAILTLAGWRLRYSKRHHEIRLMWHERFCNPSKRWREELKNG